LNSSLRKKKFKKIKSTKIEISQEPDLLRAPAQIHSSSFHDRLSIFKRRGAESASFGAMFKAKISHQQPSWFKLTWFDQDSSNKAREPALQMLQCACFEEENEDGSEYCLYLLREQARRGVLSFSTTLFSSVVFFFFFLKKRKKKGCSTQMKTARFNITLHASTHKTAREDTYTYKKSRWSKHTRGLHEVVHLVFEKAKVGHQTKKRTLLLTHAQVERAMLYPSTPHSRVESRCGSKVDEGQGWVYLINRGW